MKERPFLFKAQRVKAILAGHQTQMRMIVKPQPEEASYDPSMRDGVWEWCADMDEDEVPNSVGRIPPHGQPGDRLWVRETTCIAPKDWGPRDDSCIPDDEHCLRHVSYKADGHSEEAMRDYGLKWTPSIHVPRWASRITLEITDVRVHRIQDISSMDARAEGHPTKPWNEHAKIVHDDAARDWFMDLWDSINAKRGYSWDSNPWVWCYTFKKL